MKQPKNDTARRLRAWRELKGLAKTELAFSLGISKNAVWNWENGIGEPTQENLRKICGVLGVSRETFWGAIPKMGRR